MSDTNKKEDKPKVEVKPGTDTEPFKVWVDKVGQNMIKSITLSYEPIAYNSSGGNPGYDNALRDWKKKNDDYWKARNNAHDSGGVFMCVEPPPRPDYANYV